MTEFKDCFWGPNGFEELRKYMRLGNEFCKDLASILIERAENELNYAKGLNKTSLRLQKLSKDFHGGLSEAWLQVSIQFDNEAEMHKAFASALNEEIVKPLKILAENQNKCRKPIELRVEKVIKNLNDKKADDFKLSKDIEKSMYSLDEAQKGVGGKPPNSKEIQRIETQISKTKEYLEKSEQKYHKACAQVEIARQDWQNEIFKACNQMQSIESDRIHSLDQLIKKLSIQVSLLSKKMCKIGEVFQNLSVNVKEDLQLACKKYGTGQNEQEIFLYDVYAENTRNMMNRERRIDNLKKWSELLGADVQSQVKAKQGLEKVKTFAKENPTFYAHNEADIGVKFESVQFMQLLFESSLFKVQTALADLFANTKPTFQHSNLINTTYDKQGVPFSTLKLGPNFELSISSTCEKPTAPSPPLSPTNQTLNNFNQSLTSASIYSSLQQPIISMPMPQYHLTSNGEYSSTSSMSTASVSPANSSSSHSQSSPGQHVHHSAASQPQHPTLGSKSSTYLLTAASSSQPPPPSYSTIKRASKNAHADDTHYNNSNRSLSDEEDDDWNDIEYQIVGKCVVQYDYKGMRDDELNLKLGDSIDIIEKRSDGWWRGHLNNSIGLFPSTYVKET